RIDRLIFDRRDHRGARISCGAIAGNGGFVPLDRRKTAARARAGGTRAARAAWPDGRKRLAQFAQSTELNENSVTSATRKSQTPARCAARLRARSHRD